MTNALAPLKHRTFTFLWTAALISNIGTWMHEVGAGWLMTELSDNPLMVSLVAASTSLPIFLFVLIAGVWADIVDRRKYLLFTQGFMLVFAASLTGLTWAGMMTPWLLLFFTFAIGVGAALMMPAWDAIIPELVPKQDLPQAIALGSIGINTARAIGPALAGLIIVWSGTHAVFALNTVSFIGVILALYCWQRQLPEQTTAPERFVGALKAGLRFARNTRDLQLVLIRSALFFLPAIGLLALLPLYVRETLGGDARLLGYLQGSMGTGAIITAFIIPLFKRYLSVDALLLSAACVLATAFALLGLAPQAVIACLALFAGGMAWITAFSILRVKAQQTVPNWVRARAMAFMLMVSFGAMSIGSALWGQTAAITYLPTTYLLMAASSLVLALIGLPLSLKQVGVLNHDQAEAFDQHKHFVEQPEGTDGPVQVIIEYAINARQEQVFLNHMQALSVIRKRNGAYRWHLLRDLEQAHVYIEQFIVESWAEHERQHVRTSADEKAIRDAAFACLQDSGEKPRVRHFLHQV